VGVALCLVELRGFEPLTPCMPWTACPPERCCSEPSPLVKAGAQLPAGHRCCPLLSAASCPRHAPRAPSPQDDRRPWWAPAATQARGGRGESSVPGPTLCGDCSTEQGCTGRAGWRSRPQRRCGRCRSFGLAAPSSGRGVLLPSAPSCLERPLGRGSETLPGSSKGGGDRPVVGVARPAMLEVIGQVDRPACPEWDGHARE
jgi:hypothetical protein